MSSNPADSPIFVNDKISLFSGSFSSRNRVLLPDHFAGFSQLFVAIESLSTTTQVITFQLDLFTQIEFNNVWVTVKRESKVISTIAGKKSYDLIRIPSEVYLKNIVGIKVSVECNLTLIAYP